MMPSLTLPLPAYPIGVPDGPYATLQIHAAWSPYKNWLHERLEAVVAALPIPFVQIGLADEQRVAGATHLMMGARIGQSIAAIANATIHVGVDSFGQHVAHYYWQSGNSVRRVPSVILFGSTQATATGYDDNVNICADLACSPCFREDPKLSQMPRDPCPNLVWDDGSARDVHACMAFIPVYKVVNAIRASWEASVAERKAA